MLTNRSADQSDLFHPFSGAELRDGGMKVAIEHANLVHDDWADRAYAVLLEYINTHMGNFMCEHVRAYAKSTDLPEPPTARAFGAIIQRAFKEGVIKRVGFSQVKNPKAHCANAALWTRVH